MNYIQGPVTKLSQFLSQPNSTLHELEVIEHQHPHHTTNASVQPTVGMIHKILKTNNCQMFNKFYPYHESRSLTWLTMNEYHSLVVKLANKVPYHIQGCTKRVAVVALLPGNSPEKHILPVNLDKLEINSNKSKGVMKYIFLCA